jgi:hypothetical protein
MKLYKRVSTKLKTINRVLAYTIAAIAIVIAIVVLAWLHIIISRPSYQALGSISVSAASAPNKYYTLQVGSPVGESNLDSISVVSSPKHWYSISSNTTYSVSSATTASGHTITFYDYVVDRVHHKAYSVGPGCTIKSKTPTYCVTADGAGYYVKLQSIGEILSSH